MKTRSGRSTTSLPRNTLSLAIAAAFGLSTPLAAHAVEADWRLKATLAGVADGGRDLGLQDAKDTREGYIDTTPWLHLQFSPDWAAFLRIRGYAPTGSLLQSGQDDNNQSASKQAFVGLDEAWFEYGGLTSYPGEALRIGRQRLRNDDAEFFDEDIDAVRWIFDTTLLDADLGVARQSDTYRTDDVELPANQDHRTYSFGSLAWDWAARQQIGFRVVHADDDNHLQAVGDTVETGRRLSKGQQTWINAHVDNHPYDWQQLQSVSYWLSASYLTGSRDRLEVTPTVDPVSGETSELASAQVHDDLKAWAGDAGLRVRLGGPVQAGVAYAYSEGDGNGEQQYEQTGLQSNYSRFTGTRTQIYRYNDALRPELGNLQAATAFLSADAGAWDASLIYNKLRRPDADAPIVSDSLRVSPTVASHDLGQGVDLVLTRYFDITGAGTATAYTPDDSGDSSIRLRGSWFKPGDAYGNDAKNEYRVVLEFTAWY
ncbi:alginate export family protein [Solimonas terrae]|uniref:Alginate export family protein n=1 Tax=Solimonas terrae TaxID=1396819 RepID=A0A6M2BRM4_9GAMM|nr:alginate export family protein [Solimonas terrae]NGY04637.1 alginate export family protein [Solimonas terrae]